MSDQKYRDHGEYILEKMLIIPKVGDPLDISVIFVQLDLYESIFDPLMFGSVSITDNHNLVDTVPLYGDEEVIITFYTKGNEKNKINIASKIYKISEKHRVSEHLSGYTLFFTSPEAFFNLEKPVQASFENTCSSIVSDIYNKKLKAGSKSLSVTPSTGISKFVFGNSKPLEAISILSKHSTTPTDHGYLFFENSAEFQFKPLHVLYQQPESMEYIYRSASFYKEISQRAAEVNKSIQEIKVLNENSYMDRAMDGQHGMTAYRLNLKTREFEYYEYDKKKAFNAGKSLAEIPHMHDFIPPIYERVDDTAIGHFSEIPLERIVKSKMARIESETVRVEIGVLGNSFVKAGITTKLDLPNWNKNQDTLKTVLDGKWLIAKVHHVLTNTKYMQYIQLQKEAYTPL